MQEFFHSDCLFFLWKMESPCNLTDVYQKNPDWLVKIIFLGDVETAITSGINFMFGVMGFGISHAILGFWFSL